jgi:hypothetical protein
MEDKKDLLEFMEKEGGSLMSLLLVCLKTGLMPRMPVRKQLSSFKALGCFDKIKFKKLGFDHLYHKCLDQLKKRQRFRQFIKKLWWFTSWLMTNYRKIR